MDRRGLNVLTVALLGVTVGLLVIGGVIPVPDPLAASCPQPSAADENGTETTPGPSSGATTVTESGTAATTEITTPPPEGGYDRTRVLVYDRNGTQLGDLTVRLAETRQQKYTGLSDTTSLAPDEGMLFPYDREDRRTYVMRGMDFGIDIVYVDDEGYITRIHHAEEPPAGADGEDFRYPGCGQYVLEVDYNWTVRNDVDVGDRLWIAGYEEWPRPN